MDIEKERVEENQEKSQSDENCNDETESHEEGFVRFLNNWECGDVWQ